MAPVYKLKYFNCMGLVEPVRYLLAYGNVQYENIIVPEAEWIKMQKVVPFCKLPIFEVDSKPLFHTLAISKYIGKLVGLLPFDDWEVAELDAIVDVVYELGYQVWNWQQQGNQEVKNVMGKELIDVIVPKWLADLEAILKKKGNFFEGKKMCWADLFVVGMLEYIEMAFNKSWLPNFPCLHQLTMEVKNIPSIKSYVNKRPTYNC